MKQASRATFLAIRQTDSATVSSIHAYVCTHTHTHTQLPGSLSHRQAKDSLFCVGGELNKKIMLD